jgi:integrative and conjugative element protein (TIGR02256 family)
MNGLSPGQLLAVEQLRAVADASDGALLIVGGADAPDQTGQLIVKAALDFPAGEEQPGTPGGGVRLERREYVTIRIPPGFPFRVPVVEVDHFRFAGLPHVQWGRRICLYHSAADWDPAEGMLSTVSRLSAWYRRAARGHLDAPGMPLDPPISYTSSWAGCMVIYRDAPRPAGPVGGEPWRGAAILWSVGEERVELVGWLNKDHQLYRDTGSLYDWLEEQERRSGKRLFTAPAVILSHPMTFEFPSRVADLVKAISKQGVSATELALLLGDVAWINQVRARQAAGNTSQAADPPLYTLVGSPMRGIAGSETRLTHLAAWRLDGYEAHLASALARLWADPAPDRPQQDHLVTDAVNDWISTARVSWARVYEARPEIVERRDEKPSTRWLRGVPDGSGRRVTVLGCGALGALIAEQCLRAGASRLTLVDNGRVNPGVLVRQPYEDADVGKPKGDALAARLRRIKPDVRIEPYTGNVLTFLSDSAPPDTDLLIDATASQTVAAWIERCRWKSQPGWPPVLTVAIGHLAERGIATLANPDATGASADMMRKLALAAGTAPHLADVAADFFPKLPRTDIFQPEPGCSEPTFRGSAAEVQALASQLLAGALADLAGSEQNEQPSDASRDAAAADQPATPPPMSARIARLPYALNGSAHSRVTWDNDHAILDAESGYQVRLTPAALDVMQDEAYGVRLTHGPTVETGGMLLGRVDDASQVIWVTSATGPAPDSQRSRSYVRLGAAGAAEFLTAMESRGAGLNHFVGMWHTHPRELPYESSIDRQAMDSLLTDSKHPLVRVLLVVIGGTPDQWDAWLDGNAYPQFYTRLCTKPGHPDAS